MTRSEELFARARQLIPGGVNSPVRAFRNVGRTPFHATAAHGCRLRTADGAELIDYVLTWGPAILGHNDPDVRAAVQNAANAGLGFGTNHPAEIDFAQLIHQSLPVVEKVRLTNSGTEATMTAIRLARGCTRRHRIVKFSGCFHGHVDALLVKAGSGALTHGHPDSAGIPPATAADTLVLPYNDTAALDAAFDVAEARRDDPGHAIAAVILEPYPGNIGLLFPQAQFLETLRARCTRHGALLIFDEVMTGYRLSPRGTMGLHPVRPDLVCLGKIIGGGLPIGAIGGRAHLMDHLAPLGPVYQSGTFCGHPLTLAAGIATLKKLLGAPPYTTLDAAGNTLATAARAAAARKGIALQVHQSGSMFALFFNPRPVLNLEDVLASDATAYRRIFQHALDHGVFLPPSPYESAFISTAHDATAIAQTADVLTSAINTL
ncbi:MAG: glutamate-1-semialdehyde 2,1-aminomutase [Puniceicoccales bacterium]|jgi:glutamate-1-semialdehyde 2,1-aminomutase|nr:glutamate-1-semialdehyde 2,1-aminomutase [Puniceicoccales bacterium]